MALTSQHVTDTARKAREAGAVVLNAYWEAKKLVASNQSLAIDWGAASPASYITEALDAAGNISGQKATPAQISNVIGSLAAFISLVESGHLGNFESVL